MRYVAISNDNKFIVVGSSEMAATVWDIQTGSFIGQLGKSTFSKDVWLIINGINAVTINSTNEFIITSHSIRPLVSIWDAKTYQRIAKLTLPGRLKAESLTISDDGSTIYAACSDRKVYTFKIQQHINLSENVKEFLEQINSKSNA